MEAARQGVSLGITLGITPMGGHDRNSKGFDVETPPISWEPVSSRQEDGCAVPDLLREMNRHVVAHTDNGRKTQERLGILLSVSTSKHFKNIAICCVLNAGKLMHCHEYYRKRERRRRSYCNSLATLGDCQQ